MSRYFFSEIIKNEKELVELYNLGSEDGELSEPVDLKGYSLCDWLEQGLVGWDEALNTYFIQCFEVCRDGCDELEWWLGYDYNEIESFSQLCSIIESIFDYKVSFDFVDIIDKS